MSEADDYHGMPVRRSGSEATAFWLLLAVVAGLGCLYLLRFGGGHSGAGQHPGVGRQLPKLELQPLTGDSVPVTLDDLRGQVALVNFWGTWCPPCREEFPHLAALALRMKGRPNFRFLSVSCGTGNDATLPELRAATENYLKQIGSKLPTYADQYAYTRRNLAMTMQDQPSYPTTIVLDGQGILRGVWLGYREGLAEEMESVIEQWLPK